MALFCDLWQRHIHGCVLLNVLLGLCTYYEPWCVVFIIRLKESSAKYELQKVQLSETNRNIETMRADLAVKDKEIETCNKRYKITNAHMYVHTVLSYYVCMYVCTT